MANNQIVISRIQHRRGRRENLPQPLRPGELALTSDTNEVWIGGDPQIAVPGIIVYSDKNNSAAQNIINNHIAELKFNQSFSTSAFTSLTTYLTNSSVVTLISNDILWDETYRGEIRSITITNPGTGYSPGDDITIVSPTGSAAVIEVATVNGSGGITSFLISTGGSNYRYDNTTVTATQGGAGAVLSLGIDDVHGYSVFVAANPDVDTNNTIANVVTEANASPAGQYLIVGGALGGTISVNRFLSAPNQDAAADIATLINRVNTTTPNETTGLVHTNLNIKIGASVGGTDSTAVAPYEIAFHVGNTNLLAEPAGVLTTFIFTQAIEIKQPGTASRAYADIAPSTIQQVFLLHRNGVQFGTVTFSVGSNTGVVSIPTDTVFAAGDRMDLIAPATADAAIDDIAFTIVGEITITVSVTGAISSSVVATNSITGDGRSLVPLKLVNDSATPGNSKYYGTNAAGTRGYHDLLPTVTSLAPIGTTQGTAAAITSDWTEIINFTVGVNEGVILPEPVPGKVYRIFTSDIGTGNSLKIYPPIGKAFNNDPANQPAEIGSHTAFTIYAINTTGYRT